MTGEGSSSRARRARPAWAWVGGLLMLAAFLVPAGPAAGGSPRAAAEPDPAPRRYLDPVFDQLTETTDLVYRQAVDENGNLVDLHLDVYEPAGDTAERRPAIVWIHGGGFTFGDKTHMAWHARAMAQRGYVALSIQYRLRQSPLSPARLVAAALDAHDDARASLDWVRAHADELRVDPAAVTVAGYSAGAVTALNVGYRPVPPETSNAQAVVAIAGLSFGTPDAGEPPALMFHGTADTTVPMSWGRSTCDAILAAGLTCEFVTFEGEDHYIAYTHAEEIVDRTAQFLGEQVLEPLGYLNRPPVAEAGGPYAVDEGSSVVLDGIGSTDPDGDPLTFAWSPAGALDDPASPAPVYSAVDDGSETLTLAVSDDWGATASDPATVETLNVDPVIADVVLRRALLRRLRYVIVSFSDPGVADTHTATVDWGDGSVSPAWVIPRDGGATAVAVHQYRRSGSYQVTVAVTDDDGGTASATEPISVRPRG